jgi:NAD(P)-dependent dehydrogenase (short-subunit alcohol dehydrogenase family)
MQQEEIRKLRRVNCRSQGGFVSNVEGQVVVITGGSEGLGFALAMGFARAGASVSICARSADRLEAARAAVSALGHPCLAARVDITNEKAVGEWVRRTIDELGTPNTLVNNASVLGERVPLARYPLADWRRTLEVNVTGTLIVTQAVLGAMLGRRRGSIINVSSGAAVPPRVGWGAYGVSKDALDGLSLNLAKEVEDTGVRVNVVDPGAMRTTMRAAAYPDEDPSTLKEPAAIVPVFLWLASDSAQEITGRRIRADEWNGEV